METFDPLVIILIQKPMDGSKYSHWKTNLFIVLAYEKIKYVMITSKSQEPVTNASEEMKKKYADWQRATTTLFCYILASVANHL